MLRKVVQTHVKYISLSSNTTLLLSKNLGQKFHISHVGRSRNDYQYLERSIVPTFHFQKSLPRLPIPELEQSCSKYLASLRPLMSGDERLQTTERIVEKFLKGEGRELNKELKLLDSRNKHTSYVAGPWMDWHLGIREPLFLSSNVGFAMKDDPDVKYNVQEIRTTNILISTLRFMKSLRANLLEPTIFHKNSRSDKNVFNKIMRLTPQKFATQAANLFQALPIDMSEFPRMFGTNRVPGEGKDELQFNQESRHVVILRKGYFYVFDVLNAEGEILPSSHIFNAIQFILSDSQPTATHPIAVLTTQNRDIWSGVRRHLINIGNAEQIRLIESAQMHISLGERAYSNDEEIAPHYWLHGPENNRWLDKSFSLIISKDGKVVLNFEHSWGDGQVIIRFLDAIHKDSVENRFVGPDTIACHVDLAEIVKKLDFHLDDAIISSIEEATTSKLKIVEKLNFKQLYHLKPCRERIKSCKISPDFFAQLGLQMAYHKLFGKFVPTYVNNFTAAFKHGRIDIYWALTPEMKVCVEEMHKLKRLSNSDLYVLLRKASNVHIQLMKECLKGQGFFCHFTALQALVQQKGSKIPDIFLDPLYKEMNYFTICTGSIKSSYPNSFVSGTFAPVVDDGFGCGYFYDDNFKLSFNLSAFSPHCDAEAFGNALNESCKEAYDIINNCVK